jgi:hypothetical protein
MFSVIGWPLMWTFCILLVLVLLLRPRRVSRTHSTAPPCLEQLEYRTLLDVCSWTGFKSTSFSDAMNWDDIPPKAAAASPAGSNGVSKLALRGRAGANGRSRGERGTVKRR